MPYEDRAEDQPPKDWESLISGELVDTDGGDYTWKDVHYQKDADGTTRFYETFWGAKPDGPTQVTDPFWVSEYMEILRARG